MYDAYARIFTRMGLEFRAVAADTGQIGGSASHEFQVLADSGEDAIAWCPASDYAANVELAEALPLAPVAPRACGADAEGADARARRRARRSRSFSACRSRAPSSASCSPTDAERRAGADPDAADPRRSRAERSQGHQGCRAREIPLGERSRDRRGDGLQSRLPRARSAFRRTFRSSSTARWR